jgi:DNA-binding response OmpR family regulator
MKMEKFKTLIALNDEEEAKSFTEYLTGMGFECLRVADGAQALELALQEVPAIMVVDTDLPVIGGQKLFQILRNNPHTSRVPFMFISDSVANIKGFRAGEDIFLARPLNMEETYARLRQTLSERGRAASKVIEGKLSHMPLPDLIQFLHLNRKEGELKVTSAGKTGSVLLKEGNICNATLEGAEREKALYRMLQWTEGGFEFTPGTVASPKKIKGATGSLLMEGMRQFDEFRKHQDEFPGPNAVLKLKVEQASLPKGLQPMIYEIVQLVRANPRLSDIVERCHYPDYEVLRTVSSMIAKGVLEEEKGAEEGTAEEFLTTDQMISIREKIMGRFADISGLNYGKILIVSTGSAVMADFLNECRKIPGFTTAQRSPFSEIALVNPLGEAGSFRLYGGMDLVLFSIPTVRNMGPLWRSFSTSLAGLILLWDDEGKDMLHELGSAKRDILLKRRVPAAHAFRGTSDVTAARAALGLKPNDPIFAFTPGERESVNEVFYSLFGNLVKEDYAAV